MIATPDLWVAAICLGLGLLAAHVAGGRFGLVGALMGLPLGTVLSFLVLWGGAALYYHCAGHILPPCHEGKCAGSMRKVDGEYKMVPSLGPGYWRCACGHTYRKTPWRFERRLEDGTLEPYSAFHPLRGWRRLTAKPLSDDVPD